MKEIGLIVVGHAGIGHDMLALLIHELAHKKDFGIIVFEESLPKNNKSSNEPFEEFEFKNYYADNDFELKLAELDLLISDEKLWINHSLSFQKNKLDKNYPFLSSSNKGLLNFNSRGVRPP